MGSEAKINKRSQQVAREMNNADIAAVVAGSKLVSANIALVQAKRPTEAVNHDSLPIPKNEVDVSLIRKKKKTAPESDAVEQLQTNNSSLESGGAQVAAVKGEQGLIDSSTSLSGLFSNQQSLGAQSQLAQHIDIAPSTGANVFGALTYEMVLEMLGGAVVGRISTGIAKATLPIYDITPPATPIINSVTGDNIINAAEAASGVIITGTNEVSATTTLNGHAVVQYNATNWYYVMSPAEISAHGDGQFILNAVSRDKAGNTSITSKSIFINTAMPVAATVNTVAGDDVINSAERSASVTITGTNELNDAITVNGQAASVVGTSWSYTLTPSAIDALGQGSHILTITSTGVSGNTTTTAKTISVDTVAAVQPQIAFAPAATKWTVDPQVTLRTSLGDIVVDLNPNAAPQTVANWLAYVNSNFYSNLIFHRVIPGFMVQGGGFDASLNQVTPLYPALTLESNNSLLNTRGTIAMARTSAPNSATDQFFINSVDNTSLNYVDSSNPGYAVFGQVISGLSVVDAISAVTTQTASNGMANVPVNPVTIQSATQTAAGTAYSSGLINLVGLEAGAHWEYVLDAGQTWTSSSSSNVNITGNDGPHTLSVRQVDSAGNLSNVSTVSFILDHAAPVFTSPGTVEVLPEHAGANQLVYTAQASDAGVGQVTYSLQAGSDSGLSINSTTGAVTLLADPSYITQSAYQFTVVATDAVGNQSIEQLNLAIAQAQLIDISADGTIVATPQNEIFSLDAQGSPVNVVVNGFALGDTLKFLNTSSAQPTFSSQTAGTVDIAVGNAHVQLTGLNPSTTYASLALFEAAYGSHAVIGV